MQNDKKSEKGSETLKQSLLPSKVGMPKNILSSPSSQLKTSEKLQDVGRRERAPHDGGALLRGHGWMSVRLSLRRCPWVGWQAIHYWLSVLCGGESEEGCRRVVRMVDEGGGGARDVLAV